MGVFNEQYSYEKKHIAHLAKGAIRGFFKDALKKKLVSTRL